MDFQARVGAPPHQLPKRMAVYALGHRAGAFDISSFMTGAHGKKHGRAILHPFV
jgi:hypothetical protein